MQRMTNIQQTGARLGFVGLTTAVLVFFSEKAFWYPQGYALAELLIFYAVPVAACLWAIEHFRVQRPSALLLVAALYAVLVEGVLTPVIYEGGLLDPIMPAYFVGWHGMISLLFGWFWLRRALVQGAWGRVLAASGLFGLFWGIWSITYWLPETFVDFARPGQWPVAEFGLHALTFTLMLMMAHGLLGWGWLPQFQMSRWEKGGLMAILLFFYLTLSFLAVPLGSIKLLGLLALIGLPLVVNRRRGAQKETVLARLTGSVRPAHLLPLLLMPLAATAVYALAAWLPISEETLRLILELTPILQAALAAITFLWAWLATLRP